MASMIENIWNVSPEDVNRSNMDAKDASEGQKKERYSAEDVSITSVNMTSS